MDETARAFISYARMDSDNVDALQASLESASIPIWRDVQDIEPGTDWELRIREAISKKTLAFLACFSKGSIERSKGYQNKELGWAAEEMQLRAPGASSWLIPVRFDDCELPLYNIGGGRTLDSLNRVDLFGPGREEALSRLVKSVRLTLGMSTPSATARGRVTLQDLREVGPTHSGAVFSIQFLRTDDGTVLLSGGEDGEVWVRNIWDSARDRLLLKAEYPIRGLSIVRGSETPQFVCVSGTGFISLWDYATASRVAEYRPCAGVIWSVDAYMSRGEPLAAFSAADGTVRFWNLKTGKAFRPDYRAAGETIGPISIVKMLGRPTALMGGTGPSEDGRPRGIAHAVDLETGERWASIVSADYGPVWAIDGTQVLGTPLCITAGYSAVVHTWNIDSQEKVAESACFDIPGIFAAKIVQIREEHLVVSGGGFDDGRLRLTGLMDGELLAEPERIHLGRIQCLEVLREGSGYLIATGGDDHVIRVHYLDRH